MWPWNATGTRSVTDNWTAEPRTVPVELTPDFDHATFPPEPVRFASWTEQLESATWEQLKLLANGGVGETNA